MTIPYWEYRDDKRFDGNIPIQIKDLSSGKIYEGRMQNYSNGGIYFKSNAFFPKDTKIYISMQNSLFFKPDGVLEYYTGKVTWRENLKESYHYHGYGVQLVPDASTKELQTINGRIGKDSRKSPRKPFFRNIRLGTHEGVFDGTTKNIGATGIFLSTGGKLKLGQALKLSFPFNGKTVKILGQIVRLDEEGFGLKFIKLK